MIKKFKSFNESGELSLEKKFEYIEDLFVAVEDLGYDVKYEKGYLKWRPSDDFYFKNYHASDLEFSDNRIKKDSMKVKILFNGNKEVSKLSEIDNYIKLEKTLLGIYDRLLKEKIILSGVCTMMFNGRQSRYLFFSI